MASGGEGRPGGGSRPEAAGSVVAVTGPPSGMYTIRPSTGHGTISSGRAPLPKHPDFPALAPSQCRGKCRLSGLHPISSASPLRNSTVHGGNPLNTGCTALGRAALGDGRVRIRTGAFGVPESLPVDPKDSFKYQRSSHQYKQAGIDKGEEGEVMRACQSIVSYFHDGSSASRPSRCLRRWRGGHSGLTSGVLGHCKFIDATCRTTSLPLLHPAAQEKAPLYLYPVFAFA
ncbi:hypothetical protein E2C01_037246 [Portunus trituberculatus]|uniref:Uncharacterized protein n=1 Tax=Portunus trituberculatus TaxID=210409 RepID=A0A5B7FE58_PORTR|nr:hypothetical protein [Portunus trituberculatus]